ncbi:putative NRPS-like protein biosynthetic cluster [Asterophora parasitica]|uniref:NRPS-like protein biosynthetic cluster n=1 Tax=Asterophora parasitica TaxID=117018 RepID=A0A9P7KDZ3_9AGAR|nr:putative NRPS-like protein biosynthetic cluster [Asterophora parasitica]
MSPALARSTFTRPHINLGYGNDEPSGVNSLPELIDFAAVHNPDHIFGIQSRSGNDASPYEISFSQLKSAVEYASSWLVTSGSTTGRTSRDEKVAPVGILLGSDIAIFIYMVALLRIGTPVLLLSARLTPVAIAHLLKQTKPSSILISSHVARASKEALELLQSEDIVIPAFVDALGYEALLEPREGEEVQIPPAYTPSREDLDALIMHSSGTTGLPKPIPHGSTYPLIYAACHRLPEQLDPFRFNVSTLPLYHGFGLMAPSLSLSVGMPFIIPPASTIPTGKSTLSVLRSSGARYLLSVPSILEEILRLPDGEGIEALKNLEIVATGGAPMKENVGAELVAAGVQLLNHWGTFCCKSSKSNWTKLTKTSSPGCTELGAIAPIERIPQGYDWHYLMPRSDTGLKIIPLDDGSNSYRLVGYPPGWPEAYEVQDLLVRNPTDTKQYKIAGRADDLLVLSNGEKVRPTGLERAVAEHPDVKDVLAFGANQVSIGLLVELKASPVEPDLNEPVHLDALLASIQPYLERGNSLTDKHGKVSNEMLIFTRESIKPFIRTDKGSLARKSILAAFEEEIKASYERADEQTADPLPSPFAEDGYALLNAVRSLVHSVSGNSDIPDSVDFFEAGMDSLQASRLRRSILNGLRVTPDLPNPVRDLETDFCFENSSIEKIHRAVAHIMSGTQVNGVVGETREAKRIRTMEEMVDKYREELAGFASLAAHARISRLKRRESSGRKNVVLLTGSTGSLGCFLLARLANDPEVSKVICLNRRHSGPTTARQRQVDLMEKRGAFITNRAWEKVVLHGADLTRTDFGLSEEKFAELLSVTHIVHNAWPVNFNRNLSSFEPHVRGLSNLVRLSLLSAGRRPVGSPPTRILFASSVAVAGQFPSLNPSGPFEVPEISLGAENSAAFGYPEAKWVSERVLLAASELYGDACSIEEPLVQGANVRIGQMTGPEGSGVWNESEHFPIIVRTAQQLGALPALEGSLSWLPVNRAGDILTELLFSKGFKPFYHMENPSRQSWSGIISNLADILGGKRGPLPLIPLSKWLLRVRDLGDDPARNPAFKILGFLERDFQTMSNGTVILRTATARLDSPTMVKSTAVDRKHLEEYISYWRSIEAMN